MAYRGHFHLPVDHAPVMRVAPSGARCSTCTMVRRRRDGSHHCASRYYREWMGTTRLPYPPGEMCSDWYQPRTT
jgi:hypothetical protein